jgi:hypothetical protein
VTKCCKCWGSIQIEMDEKLSIMQSVLKADSVFSVPEKECKNKLNYNLTL